MNRTAFKEVVHLAHELTNIRGSLDSISDLMRQATHALKVETAIVQHHSGCGVDLHHIASRLLVDLLETQERWSTSSVLLSGNEINSEGSLSNISIGADVELQLVECFFTAQSIGTRLQSHLRDLIRSVSGCAYSFLSKGY